MKYIEVGDYKYDIGTVIIFLLLGFIAGLMVAFMFFMPLDHTMFQGIYLR